MPRYEEWERKRLWLQIWRRARQPFTLPFRLQGHDCTPHWELLDIDVAGCRVCGRVHLCSASPADIQYVQPKFNFTEDARRRDNTDSDCQTETCESNVVCGITAFCVRSQLYSEQEFVDTVTIPRGTAPKNASMSYKDVLPHIHRVLCSEDSRRCLQQENERVRVKMRHIMQKILREHKCRH
eukprot:3936105-Rhodomonas_salina.3